MGHRIASGQWSPEQASLHINALELEAVCLAFYEFAPSLTGRYVLLCTDNTTVACYVSKQLGGRGHALGPCLSEPNISCVGVTRTSP